MIKGKKQGDKGGENCLFEKLLSANSSFVDEKMVSRIFYKNRHKSEKMTGSLYDTSPYRVNHKLSISPVTET